MSLTLLLIFLPLSIYVLVRSQSLIQNYDDGFPYNFSRLHQSPSHSATNRDGTPVVDSYGGKRWSERITLVPAYGQVAFDRWIQVGTAIVAFAWFGFGKDAVEMYKKWMRAAGFARIFPGFLTETGPSRNGEENIGTTSMARTVKGGIMLDSMKSKSAGSANTSRIGSIASTSVRGEILGSIPDKAHLLMSSCRKDRRKSSTGISTGGVLGQSSRRASIIPAAESMLVDHEPISSAVSLASPLTETETVSTASKTGSRSRFWSLPKLGTLATGNNQKDNATLDLEKGDKLKAKKGTQQLGRRRASRISNGNWPGTVLGPFEEETQSAVAGAKPRFWSGRDGFHAVGAGPIAPGGAPSNVERAELATESKTGKE